MEKQKIENKKGIRRKILTSTIAVTIILALVLVGVMMYFMSTSASSILKETLMPIAKTSAQSVEGNLHILSDRLLLTKDNEILSSPKTSLKQKQSVLDRTMSGIEFVWLAIYDNQGNLLTGSSASPKTLIQEDITLYDDIIATENLVINDTVQGESGPEISIGVPILGADQKVSQILVGSYKYDVLNDTLSNINVGSGGTALIVNNDGKVMGHKDVTKVAEAATINTILGESDKVSELFNQMKLGQTNTVEFTKDKEQLFLSYAPVRGTDWTLIIMTQKDDFTSANKQAIAISIAVTFFLLLLAIIYSANMSKRIQRPLGRVTDRITELANGDLHSKVTIEKTKDETETLSLALNKTVNDVNSYTSELSRVLTELSNSNLDVSVNGNFRGDFVVMKDSLNEIINFLNNMMDSIQQGSAQVLETSMLVANNAESVKTSSSSQSESIIHLNEETASIQDNIVEVKNSTTQVATLMDKVRNTLVTSEDDMRNALKSMEEISTNSDEITEINKLLEDISFQTNILSLNAAVEAVNAGLAGKGFAVVADEVRALAEKSSESSKKTRMMIEQSKQSINEGSTYVDRLADTLRGVLEMIQEISDITINLTQAVATQTSSLENITNQVNNINSLASSNLAASSTSAEASHELTHEADALREMADKFKLRTDKGGKHND